MGNKVENHIRQLGHKVYTRGKKKIYRIARLNNSGKPVIDYNIPAFNSEEEIDSYIKNNNLGQVFVEELPELVVKHPNLIAKEQEQEANWTDEDKERYARIRANSGWSDSSKITAENAIKAEQRARNITPGAVLGQLASGLNVLSPSQQFGAIVDWAQGEKGYWEGIGGGNSGFFTDEYAKEHPIWTLIGNGAIDTATGLLGIDAINAAGNGVRGIVSKGKSVVDTFRNARKVVKGRGPLLNPRYKVSYSSTEGLNWDTPDVVTPEGVKLADGTLTKSTEGFDDLEKYFGQGHIKYNGNTTRYSHNGRKYTITQSPGKYVVTTPEGTQSFSYPTGGDIFSILTGKAGAKKGAQEFILNSRNNWINSLDDISQQVVRRQQTAPRITVDSNNQADLSDRELVLKDGPIYDFVKNSVRSDIDNVYLSDAYIDRYMKSLGQDPKDLARRSTVSKILKRDLYHTDLINDPMYYQLPPDNGGLSSSDAFIYGINGNAGQNFLTKDNISSTIFHEFGHNLFGQNTSTGKYIRAYDTNLLKDDNPLDNLSMTADIMSRIDPNLKKHIDYLSKPTEFRQRVMEGVRYGIINGNLTPEQIYKQCQLPGFLGLKRHFTKQYLIKMLGAMLGTAPVIINTTNDKSS